MGNVLKGDAGGSAFPLVFDIAKGSNSIDGQPAQADERHICVGLSVRDYFAAKAMQADLDYQGLEGRDDLMHIAEMAYQMADAMLKAREGR